MFKAYGEGRPELMHYNWVISAAVTYPLALYIKIHIGPRAIGTLGAVLSSIRA